MLNQQKVIELIVKLTRLTVERRLDWKIQSGDFKVDPEEEFGSPVYTGELEGVCFRIFETHSDLWTSNWITEDGEDIRLSSPRAFRRNSLVLQIIGKHGFADAEFRDLPGLSALFDAVRVSNSRLDTKIDTILAIR